MNIKKTTSLSEQPMPIERISLILGPENRIFGPHPFHADPDQDPGFQIFADLDPDPGFQIYLRIQTLIRIQGLILPKN